MNTIKRSVNALSFGSKAFRNVVFAGTVAGALFNFAPQALAVTGCNGEDCVDVKIDRIQTQSYSNKVFVSTTGEERYLSCSPSGYPGVYLLLNPASPLFAQMYDTLLKGLELQKDMLVRIAIGSNPCVITMVHINR